MRAASRHSVAIAPLGCCRRWAGVQLATRGEVFPVGRSGSIAPLGCCRRQAVDAILFSINRQAVDAILFAMNRSVRLSKAGQETESRRPIQRGLFDGCPNSPTASRLSKIRSRSSARPFLVPFAEAPNVPCSIGPMSATDSRCSCMAATSSLSLSSSRASHSFVQGRAFVDHLHVNAAAVTAASSLTLAVRAIQFLIGGGGAGLDQCLPPARRRHPHVELRR